MGLVALRHFVTKKVINSNSNASFPDIKPRMSWLHLGAQHVPHSTDMLTSPL